MIIAAVNLDMKGCNRCHFSPLHSTNGNVKVIGNLWKPFLETMSDVSEKSFGVNRCIETGCQ